MKRPILLMFALLGLTGTLFASQTLHFDDVAGSFGGNTFSALSYGGPYYVSPYFGHLDSNPARSTVLFCLDFDHSISIGAQTPAAVRSLPTDGTFQDGDYQFGVTTAGNAAADFINGALPTMFAGNIVNNPNLGADIHLLTAYQRYEATMYLLYNNLTLAGPPILDAHKRAAYQYAMWAMFLQNGPPDGNGVYKQAIHNINSAHSTFGADVNALVVDAYTQVINSANDAFFDALLPHFTVVSSTNNPSALGQPYQEFLSLTGIPPRIPGLVPEPSSFLLLGTTVFAVGLAWRRRRTA